MATTTRPDFSDVDAGYGAPETIEHDGVQYRVTVDLDDMPVLPIQNWGDIWGKTSEYAYDYTNDRETPRPDGFTGNAEKIEVDRGYWVWWEPFNDGGDYPINKRGTSEFDQYRAQVTDLLRTGFYVVTLERLEGIDAYGQPIVAAFASLGGIDSLGFASDFLAEICGELFDELTAE